MTTRSRPRHPFFSIPSTRRMAWGMSPLVLLALFIFALGIYASGGFGSLSIVDVAIFAVPGLLGIILAVWGVWAIHRYWKAQD